MTTLLNTGALAAQSRIINEPSGGSGFEGQTQFFGGTAGEATILMKGAQIESAFAGTAFTATTFTIGSLEGEGTVYLGQKTLQVGANNLDTSFASLLRDGNAFGSTGPGFLNKVGTGAFRLTGANTYTGGTSVISGKLVVANSTGSATGTGPVQSTRGSWAAKASLLER